MRQEGKDFKPIFGIEAYFVKDLDEWREEYERQAAEKKNKGMKKKDSGGTVVETEERRIKGLLRQRSHLILLAQNQEGLNNIFELVSKSFKPENFYRFPRIDYKMLKEHSNGILAASACLSGIYSNDYWRNKDDGDEAILEAMRETTRNMQEIFGDRWYGELQWNASSDQHKINKFIIQLADEFGIELISTADSHYPTPDAWKDRELYRRLAWLGKSDKGSKLPDSVDEVGYELYPKNGDQMWEAYKKYAEKCGEEYDDKIIMDSITLTADIAKSRIETFMPDTTVRLPDFVVPEGMDEDQALARYSVDGLKRILDGVESDKQQGYIDRLKGELEVIKDRGFSKYFLTMKAIADKSSEIQLVSPGRGSAAGSLVAYALNITQVDPIKYGLLFGRFLRADATDYPDIDYDVSDPMTIKELLVEEWGENTVVPISNWNTLQLRSLVKDISKFYNIPFTEVNAVTGKMLFEATPLAKKDHGITAGVYAPTWEEVMKYSKTLQAFLAKYPDIKGHIEALVGQVRSCSRHAGGVVIAENLHRNMPLIYSGGVRQTPWAEGQNVRHLEPMGFIKFDILGLASLRMIDGAVRHILKRKHGNPNPTFDDVKKFYDENLHPDVIDLTDQSVYENIFHKGRWAGVFQFTEQGSQSFCRRAKPTNIIDLAAVTAIFRPGPLSAKVDKHYIKAKADPDSIEYINDVVREVTEETCGFLIFQEQIAMLAHLLGDNISLDEGNSLRKVLTKKGTGKAVAVKKKLHEKFFSGCIKKGLRAPEAERLWETFEYFSGYGFNKSHAVSYSILSFQCAWLLNYYPAEWMAAFLDKEPEKRKEKAINLAKKHGFGIQPIDINTSGSVWEISDDDKTLIQPLTSIKGLGEAAIKQIVDHRPFATIEEFLFDENIVYGKLNKKAVDVLVRSQALNSLMDDRFSGMKHFWSTVAVDRPKTLKKLVENIELYHPEGDFTAEEKIEYLVSLTGVFPMQLIMSDRIREELESHVVPPLGEFDVDIGVAWFVPREVIPKKTKHGKVYWILKVTDATSTLTSIKCWGVDPDRDTIHINRPYMAKLDYDPQWGFSSRSLKHNFKLLG
jgi:DNA polymerase-3 subunit alpha